MASQVGDGVAGAPLSHDAAVSRKARRAAERARAGSRRKRRQPWLARAGVLGALAGLTIAVPLANAASGAESAVALAASADQLALPTAYPSTIDALTNAADGDIPAAVLAGVDLSARTSTVVSRGELREPLPGCDSQTMPVGTNGQLASDSLCTLWDGTHLLRADAAVSLTELNDAYRAQFGVDICLSSAYRSLSAQRVLRATKPGLAAVPGSSNHGWGLAVDLCSSVTAGTSYEWIKENAPLFGWTNPDWAKRGGGGPYEPWHWEFATESVTVSQ